jgi:hypothetical protein
VPRLQAVPAERRERALLRAAVFCVYADFLQVDDRPLLIFLFKFCIDWARIINRIRADETISQNASRPYAIEHKKSWGLAFQQWAGARTGLLINFFGHVSRLHNL